MSHAYLMAGRSSSPPIFCQKATFETRREAAKKLKRFGTHPATRGMVATAGEGGQKRLVPYKCGSCGLFHLGHV